MSLGYRMVRDIHVSAGTRDVVAHVLGKLKPAAMRPEFRQDRHALLRDALHAHRKHQALVRKYRL